MSTTDPKGAIATRFLDSLLSELILDTALHAHATVKKARAICSVCGTRCQAHTPAAHQLAPSSTTTTAAVDVTQQQGALAPPTPSASSTPAPSSQPPSSNPGTSIKPDYYSHNPLFECLVCSRQVSSNRYATHLAKCMGIGGKGSRKGAARGAKAVNAPMTLAGSATPLSSRLGSVVAPTPRGSDDDAASASGAAGGRKKKLVPPPSAPSQKGKRARSPPSASHVASLHINKKIKTSSPTPPPLPPSSFSAEANGAGVGLARSHSAHTLGHSGLSHLSKSAGAGAGTTTGSPLNPVNGRKNAAVQRRGSVERGGSEGGNASAHLVGAGVGVRRGSASSSSSSPTRLGGSNGAVARNGSPLKRQRGPTLGDDDEEEEEEGALEDDDEGEEGSGYDDRPFLSRQGGGGSGVGGAIDDDEEEDDDDRSSDEESSEEDEESDDDDVEEDDEEEEEGEEEDVEEGQVSLVVGRGEKGKGGGGGGGKMANAKTYASRSHKVKSAGLQGGASREEGGVTSDSDGGETFKPSHQPAHHRGGGGGGGRGGGGGGSSRSSPDLPLGGTTSTSRGIGGGKPARTAGGGGGGGGSLERERGSDGEFINVESASEQSDGDLF